MILDNIQNAHRYFDIHPGFKEAFNFLKSFHSDDFKPQKIQLNASDLIAIIEPAEGRTRQGARLEAHRKYIDIQYTYHGFEEIGWKWRQECQNIDQSYNDDKDIEFFSDMPTLWLPIPRGTFTILFPDDAHAPLAGENPVNKIIMKVAVI